MASRGRILIVDDEANARAALSEILREEGYTTETAADGFKALGKLEEFVPDVVLTDLKMPGLDGIGFMEKAQAALPGATFVVMTAFGTIGSAVEAVKKGAYNYLTKPLDFSVLAVVVERAVERARLLQENSRLREKLRERNPFGHVVATHPSMVALLRLVEQVAPSRASVLILGETGTGKELIAEMIHRESPRAKAPLVRLNCAALSESLLESELFGHEKGSFTGAIGRREGRFEQANGGTIFLDEVSEIPLATQVKLLRVLQERKVKPVGSTAEVPFEARLLAATNKRLEDEVRAGRFREDLFYRLNVITIELPPLRDRRDDIPELAQFFLSRLGEGLGKSAHRFSDEAMQVLQRYAWPGNVRQLENIVERAVTLAETAVLGADTLPPALRGEAPAPAAEIDLLEIQAGFSLEKHLDDAERRLLVAALRRANGVKTRAAELLGLTFRSFRYRLAKHGLGDPAEEVARST